MKNSFFAQTIKYGIVGVMNSLLTLVTIWFMMHIVFKPEEGGKISSWALSVSNTVGYIVGLINSFIWNRTWTFKSKNNWKPEFIRFTTAFLICFAIQLILVNILYKYVVINEFHFNFFRFGYTVSAAEVCQLIGIVTYTALNFFVNKYFTFKK